METISPAPDDSLNANPSSVKSDDSSPRPESGRGSPPPKCAICLGTCRNKSFTDSCLHQFCFTCLLTWSKVKAECPLCKQVFKSIIHNVRSNHQYEEYMVEQRQEIPEMFNLENIAPRRFRYRTTVTLPLRDSMVFEHFLQQHQLNTNVIASRPHHSPTSFRRTVYRHNLWARPLPDFTGRFRDCTPEFYRYNDAQMHRLVHWLNRELHYLLNENQPHVAYVLSRIMELLREYPINSQEFRNAVNCYFGDRTEHFLHELYCFASTPYDLTGYDRHVQYSTDPRVSTMVNEVLSSSDSDHSVDSDIVMVTSSASLPPLATAGPSRPPAPSYPPHYLPAPVVSIETISHSDTDDDDVLVVGYIKPPEQRTPEVVDLLGSDSDVVVQDPPAPPAAAETAAATSTPLVKIRLKHTAPPLSPDSDSDARRCVQRRPGPTRRRRRRRSNRPSSAESWLPQRHTPISNSTSTSSSLSSTSSSLSSSTTSSSSDESSTSTSTSLSDDEPTPKKRKTVIKTKKTSSKPLLPSHKDKTRSNKKTESTRSNRNKDSERNKDKKSNSSIQTNPHRKDKNLKRKSRSKKDAKSSRKSKSNKKEVPPSEQHRGMEVELTPAEELPRDQPSTSGTQNNSNTSLDTNSPQINKRDDSRERKRLKSVVKVMNWTPSDSSDTPPNLLNIVSSPKSNIINYNSGCVPSDKKSKNKASDNILEKADSFCNWSNASDRDSDSDIPLNLSMDSS